MFHRGPRTGRSWQRRTGAPIIAFLSTLSAVALCAGNLTATPRWAPQTERQVGLADLSDSLESVVDAVIPAVVQIIVSGYAPVRPGSALLSRQQSGGSGAILDPDGYIVTNAHVVEGARRIQVRLPAMLGGRFEGRSILKPTGELVGATLIGLDRETDLAVLKIQRQGLPYLQLGDSDEIRAGQIVLALGSPFGLENSVSIGVVSARARQLEPEDPMIYIQTDAPINPGNSGGPLVDTAGRIVGINTMIFSQSGGNEGIGFAAPSNIVRFVYEQIRANLRVRRGVIGTMTQTITPLLASGLGLSQDWGVVVSDVYAGSPAALAGLEVGDVILTLNGKTMENARQFDVNMYRQEIGGVVSLEVVRGTETLMVPVKIVEREDDPNRFASMVTPERNLVPELGLLCVDVDEEVARLLPALRIQTGVLVAAKENAAGPGADFLPGDVIHAINRVSIRDLEQLKRELSKLRSLAPVVAQIERQGRLIFIAFEME